MREITSVTVYINYDDDRASVWRFEANERSAVRVDHRGAGNFTLDGETKQLAMEMTIRGIVSDRVRDLRLRDNPREITES